MATFLVVFKVRDIAKVYFCRAYIPLTYQIWQTFRNPQSEGQRRSESRSCSAVVSEGFSVLCS